jgi:hypothetical protein
VAVAANGHVRQGAAGAEILGSEVWICSLGDLKSMRRAAGRTRDLADLDAIG